MDFTTRYSCLVFMEITEYGHRPFVEGFIEDFTDPLLYYIFIGVIVSFVIVYFVKLNERKKVEDGELDNSIQEDITHLMVVDDHCFLSCMDICYDYVGCSL